tara:strand:- start:276 stop:1808 length:1533 start_codon:yes stop_codon:yes gene_type:complete
MAATTLTEATEAEILKIFKVVANKSITSIEGMVQVAKPKLNQIIAETIDAFREQPNNVSKTMDKLILRMKDLGMSVDDLTRDMKTVPKSMETLQNALRAKEQQRTKVEKQVQELRERGIAAEVKKTTTGVKVRLITQKEMIKAEKDWKKQEKEIIRENIKLQKLQTQLEKNEGKGRAKLEKQIIDKKEKIVSMETTLTKKKEQKKGDTSNIRGGEDKQGMIDSQGILGPLADQFMAIKDSITSPFIEMGALAKRIGVSFRNFGKAMLTPIKSLKLFGANLMLSIVPLMLKTLAFLAVVAIIAVILFKLNAIKDKLAEWWNAMAKTLAEWWQGVKEIGSRFAEWVKNIPTMLGEALSGVGDKIMNLLGDVVETVGDMLKKGFFAMINAPIKLLNKVPGINIPLLGEEGAAAAEAGSTTADSITKEASQVQKVQMDKDESEFKPWTWNKDNEETAEVMKNEAVAPVGNNNAVIVQDNKTITNTQSNSETAMVAKADKNPEPSSFWDKISFWN